MSVDQREFPRVRFDLGEGFIGDFRLDNEDQFTAMIINISGGGAGLAIMTRFVEKIRIGDVMTLKKIVGAVNLEFLSDIPAEIRWIKNIDQTGYVGAGCEFQEMTKETRLQLVNFVESERKFRGQYD